MFTDPLGNVYKAFVCSDRVPPEVVAMKWSLMKTEAANATNTKRSVLVAVQQYDTVPVPPLMVRLTEVVVLLPRK